MAEGWVAPFCFEGGAMALIPRGLYHARLVAIQDDRFKAGYKRLVFVIDDEQAERAVYNGCVLGYRVDARRLERVLSDAHLAVGDHALLQVGVFIAHDGDEMNYVQKVYPRLYPIPPSV